MPVQTFNPADAVSAGNWAVAQRLVGAFAPHAQATLDMTVALDKGWLLNGTTLTEVNPQTVGPFTAPADRRVDRIVIDRTTGGASIVAGTEGSLVPPAIPAGTLPVTRVVLGGATVEIANEMLFDERVLSDLSSSGSLNATLTALGALDATPGLVEQTGAAAFVKHALGVATADSVPTRADADGRYLQLTGGTLTGALTLSGAPVAPQQAATKSYVDTSVQAVQTAVTDLSSQTAPLSNPTFGTKATAPYFVSTVATGTAPLTVASTTAVANLNADLLDGQHGSYYAPLANLASYVPLAGGTLTGALTLSGDPTNALHPASKQYVDNALAGWFAKQPVKLATTANITLSGAQTIDGVAAVAGDRVLVKSQTAPAENGVYVVASGAWSRASDFNLWAEIPGAFVFVNQGSANGDRAWVCTADAGGTLDSTAIGFSQFMGTGAYQASSAELSGLSALSAAGMVARTGAGAYAARTVAAAGSDIIAVTNGDGVAGSPTIGTSMATGKLLGRSTAGTGAVEQITLGTGLALSGGTLSATVSGGGGVPDTLLPYYLAATTAKTKASPTVASGYELLVYGIGLADTTASTPISHDLYVYTASNTTESKLYAGMPVPYGGPLDAGNLEPMFVLSAGDEIRVALTAGTGTFVMYGVLQAVSGKYEQAVKTLTTSYVSQFGAISGATTKRVVSCLIGNCVGTQTAYASAQHYQNAVATAWDLRPAVPVTPGSAYSAVVDGLGPKMILSDEFRLRSSDVNSLVAVTVAKVV
ncbi:hypothetical protein [Azospirillum sp. sgz301742]